MKEVSYEEYVILIGENANEDQQLVLNSGANDYWAHNSGYPSAHAVIRNPSGAPFHNKVVNRACCIIKSASNKCKSIPKLQFDVCRISNLVITDTPGLIKHVSKPSYFKI